jgi:Na+-translocating ferredoxin:NAD+ oxidoreductase RnfE subunit
MKLFEYAPWERPACLACAAAVVPMLAASADAVTGLCLALATLLVLGAVERLTKPLPDHALATQPPIGRASLIVIAISGLVACVELFLGASSQPLFMSVGAFLPLLAAATLPSFASAAVGEGISQPPLRPLQAAALVFATGCLRELLGHGTLFRAISPLPPVVGPPDRSLLLSSPAAGFLVAAVLIALLKTLQKPKV